MPLLKPFMINIPDMYRASFEDTSLFFYYLGIKEILPNVTDERIVAMWLNKMNLSEDEYSLKTALHVLFNQKKRFLQEKF